MKEKIDWYQEVLELEPGSKVFFPLARLLAESGQTERSVQTLRQGLDRHPEFIEARLYLIDLLHRTGMTEQCEEQISLLSPLFARYKGFWQAWGSSVAASGKAGDTGLALSFLAAAFQQGSLTLAEVLQQGLLTSLNGVAASEKPATGRVSLVVSPRPAPKGPVTSAPTVKAALPQQPVVQAAPPAAAPEADILADDDGEEGEERFSLRTRSMAEVLAEQGDYAGALEIYQELSAQAASPEEAADLQYRISTLTAHLGAAQQPVPEPEATPSPSKHRVLSVLEALAERLENRVHG